MRTDSDFSSRARNREMDGQTFIPFMATYRLNAEVNVIYLEKLVFTENTV